MTAVIKSQTSHLEMRTEVQDKPQLHEEYKVLYVCVCVCTPVCVLI